MRFQEDERKDDAQVRQEGQEVSAELNRAQIMPLTRRGRGRPKGSPNKATRAWKDFVAEVAASTDQQEALRRACLDRPELLLKVAEHAVGKPTERVEVKGEFHMIEWPSGQDIAEE
jgi:hypothetical protein